MWSFFKRLFRIGKAEANSALDKLENPIKMTQQGIRDLKKDLDESLKSLAEVKAIHIRSKREMQVHKQTSDDYEKKAMALLKRGQAGQMDAAEAERLAAEALARREETMKLYQVSAQNAQKYGEMVDKMQGKIRQLKSQVSKWENELRTLEARDKVSKATGKLNKQMSNIDSSGTLAMLEKMKTKVEEQEALSDAYGEMAEVEKSVDDEINKALNDPTITASAALDDLKRKMGMLPAATDENKIEIKEEVRIEVDKNNTNQG